MDIITNKNILVIGAHADDETLGVGGTILKARSLHSTVDVLIVTDSTSSQYIGDLDKKESRGSNLALACNKLDVNNLFELKFPDMKLDTIPHVDINIEISQFIEKGRYDTIFVHHPGDINKDHQILFDSVMVACRPKPESNVSAILTYYVVSSSEWGGYENATIFTPNVFVDISQFIEKKIRAFKSYKDEIRQYPHPRSEENIINTSKYFGAQVGLESAEPFRLLRLLN